MIGGTRWLVWVVLAPIVCHGQTFTNLRAARNGDLYFLTGGQPIGGNLPAGRKLFVKDAAGIRLFPGGVDVDSFELSADGGVLALYRGGATKIVNANGDEWMRVNGTVRLSPNGRYAAVQDTEGVSLLDIPERRILRKLEKATLPVGVVVASNGFLLAVDVEKRLVLVSAESAAPVNVPLVFAASMNSGGATWFFLQENARSVAFTSGNNCYIKVFTSTAPLIALPLSLFAASILRYDGLSLDYQDLSGARRLYLDGRPAETLFERLGLEVAAIDAGHFAFVARGVDLYEYELAVNRLSEVATATPFPSSIGTGTPGSIVAWRVALQRELARVEFAAPYPREVEGLRVLLNGQPVPLRSVNCQYSQRSGLVDCEIQFLVPWSLPLTADTTAANMSLNIPGSVLFVPEPAILQVLKQAPSFIRTQQRSAVTNALYPRARRGGLDVRPDLPAEGGQSITMAMRGLGPVTEQPPDDRLSPENYPIASMLDCWIGNGLESQQISVAAVLSTAEFGVYDVTLRLPEMRSLGEFHLGCEMGNAGDNAAIPVRRTE